MFKRPVAYVRQFDKSLWILSLGWFVAAMGFAVSIPFIAIYFHAELGMSMSKIGVFFGVMAIIRSIFQTVGGELSDRMERRVLLIYSQIIRSVLFLGLALAIYFDLGFWAVGVSLMLNSMVGAVFQPTANAMVSDILPQAKRLDGFAITRSAGNLGWAAGPAIGGFLANYSYGHLFVLSAIVTFLSGLIFLFFLVSPPTVRTGERFSIKDLVDLRKDPMLGMHSILIFILYLVVAQLMAPFSVYTVEMAGITEKQLGFLYTLNGLLVVSLQIPVMNLLRKMKLTHQLALGGFIYAIGYGLIGSFVSFNFFIMAIVIVTLGEVCMSPPSLALTSKLAPAGRMGRYMGIFGFFVASGWSFGPLYGGVIIDHFGSTPSLAWILISSLALISALGYLLFTRKLPDEINSKEDATVT